MAWPVVSTVSAERPSALPLTRVLGIPLSMESNLGNFVGRFGLMRGLGLYFQMRPNRGVIDLDVPGIAAPVALRGGTSDRHAFQQVFVNGDYETRYPGRPRFIIDAGANVGFAGVQFASLYPDARIVCIEPDQENFAVLQRNISRYTHVTAIRAGIWHRDAQLTVANPEDENWALRVREASAGEPSFPAVSIDRILADSGCSTIDILKLDIEGAELELFEDPRCDTWLSRTNMLFVETHDRIRPGCEAALAAAAARHPFRRSTSGENVLLVREPLVV